MSKTRTGQPRKRGERKEDVGNATPPETEAPKKEIPKPLDFAVPEGGFDVAVPEGYEFGNHRMLKKEEFTEEAVYFEYRAAAFRWRAAVLEVCAQRFDHKAEDARRFGSGEERKQVKQLRSLRAKELKLREGLAEKGIDVEAALAEG